MALSKRKSNDGNSDGNDNANYSNGHNNANNSSGTFTFITRVSNLYL